MRMAEFADRLFTDLMAEYRPVLEQTELPEPRTRRSATPVWLTGGLASVAALVTTVLLLLTTGGPAYAVTPNPDGTVTVTLNQMTALSEATAALHALGAPTAVGCPGAGPIEVIEPRTNTVVINPKGIPPGQVGVLFAEPRPAGAPLISWHVVPARTQDCAALAKALANARKAAGISGGR